MNRLSTILVLMLLLALSEATAQRRFRIAEYNVENLFDTLHTEGFHDEGFTPEGDFHWTSRPYFKKLGLLARTIAAIGGVQPADLVMLCEVEGDSVMVDLTQRTMLRRLGYEYIISHSQDYRGINVALLYQPYTFKPLYKDSLRIAPLQGMSHTRDILHVCGLTISGDTLDVFMVHMPSRRGGRRQSEKWRCEVAHQLRDFTDSIIHQRYTPNIIILGDFNDETSDASIRKFLKAVKYNNVYISQPHELFVLQAKSDVEGIEGTYRFKGKWYELDHIILSGNLFRNDTGLRLIEPNVHIFAPSFLLENEGRRIQKPRRTYRGTYYHGGVSDHLPIYVDFEY